jgi:hypothetical protein
MGRINLWREIILIYGEGLYLWREINMQSGDDLIVGREEIVLVNIDQN